VILGGNTDLSIEGGGSLSAAGVQSNVYEDLLADAGVFNSLVYQGKRYYTLAEWQSACGCDSRGQLAPAAKINAGNLGQLLSGSVGVNAASNLTNITSGTLALLAKDIVGAFRPSSGNWDAGAYKFGSTALPTAPSGVRATVQ
jgi:hypothetical protein